MPSRWIRSKWSKYSPGEWGVSKKSPGDNRWPSLVGRGGPLHCTDWWVSPPLKSWLAYSLRWLSVSERLFPILLLPQHKGWLLTDVLNYSLLESSRLPVLNFWWAQSPARLKRVVIELARIILSIATLSHNTWASSHNFSSNISRECDNIWIKPKD